MGVGVLGPVEVDGAAPLEPRDRMALGVLVVRHGETVSPDQFADALWADRPPASWSKQVQICIGRLRRVLGSDAIATIAGGYRLMLDDDEIDVRRFECVIDRARELGAVGQHDRAAATYRRALDLWRGSPLDDLDVWLPARSEVARLQELRRTIEEEWLTSCLEAGEPQQVAARLEGLVNEEPLRERRWALMALAQYRCTRQVDALRSLARARRVLGDVGIAPGNELVALEAAILRQDPALTAVVDAVTASPTCPYKGLAPYDEGDTDSFFGRDVETEACIDRLRATPLLVVAGPSGCGKSSLVRAGVVPALRRGGHDVMVFSPGSDPMAALADARQSSDGAVWAIDQFEELFTLTASADVHRSFCAALVGRAQHSKVVVVVRSDHLGGFAVDGWLSDLVERGLHLVSTLTGDALRDAIEQPARMAGFRLEHGLVDLLVRDCEGEPGALPLLSHALTETWHRREGTTLTVDGYRSSGGIRGAVARSADRLYDSLHVEQRDALRSILLRLVTPTLDGEPVRCRVASRSILGDPGREQVVGLLVRARLVTSEQDTFEIAHEALARAWPRLRSWLDDDVAGQRVLRHLVGAADGWDSLGRPDTELYRGARLETALEWRDHAGGVDLTDVEYEFLDASERLAASEQRALVSLSERESRNSRRLRRLSVALSLLLLVSLVAGVVAFTSSRQAERARRVASAQGLAAAAVSSVGVDPERGVLLAIEAVERARGLDRDVLAQAEEALHSALTGTPILWRASVTGGAVDWSPDGRHVATEGPEGSDGFDIRDADTGDVVRSLAVPGSDVADLQYNPDGTVLATTDRHGTTHLWNPATGELLTSIEGSGSLVQSPSFSPDGSLIAVASPTEGRVRIFDTATGSVVLDTRSVRGANATSWSPDGTRLAVASADEPVGAVLDVSSGDIIATLDGHFAALSDIEWSPDGLAIATSGNDGSAHVFSAESGSAQMVIPGHGAAVGAVGWSASSTSLATASADGTVKIWGVIEGGGRALAVLTGDDMRSGVDDVAFSPDGTKLIAGGRSGVTSVWDVGLDAGSEIATLPAAAYFVGTAEFDASGERLYATGAGGRVAVWDTDTWELVRYLGTSGASGSADTSPAGAPLGSAQDFMRIAPSPDGELVAAVSDASARGLSAGRVRAFDTTTGEIVIDVTLGSHASDAHWSPDGGILAVAGRDDQGALVRMVDRSGRTVGQLRFGDVVVGVAGFDAAENRLVVWIEPPLGLYEPDIGRVEVWDWRSETLVRTIDFDAYVAVTSPLGDLVAVGPHDNAPDQTLGVWSTRTGQRIATLDGHSGSPNLLAFTADGRRLAVAGGDGTTRIWDPVTGELQLTLGGHIALVSASSFNPDGTKLATTSADGRVRIWALDTDTLLAVARQRVTRSLTDAECRRYLSHNCDN